MEPRPLFPHLRQPSLYTYLFVLTGCNTNNTIYCPLTLNTVSGYFHSASTLRTAACVKQGKVVSYLLYWHHIVKELGACEANSGPVAVCTQTIYSSASDTRSSPTGILYIFDVDVTFDLFLLLWYQYICSCYCTEMGTAVAQWLRCCATNRKVACSIPAGVIGIFHWHKILPIALCSPGVESASNRNEYQEYFLGGKGGRCVRLTTLPPSCAVFTKSGNLNFLEPSGPVEACDETALPLPLPAVSTV